MGNTISANDSHAKGTNPINPKPNMMLIKIIMIWLAEEIKVTIKQKAKIEAEDNTKKNFMMLSKNFFAF